MPCERKFPMDHRKPEGTVYIRASQGMHSACTQSIKATRMLARGQRRTKELLDALEARRSPGLSGGAKLWRKSPAATSTDPAQAHCKAMEGLVAEAKARIVIDEDLCRQGRPRPAAIVDAVNQRMAHYAIARATAERVLAFARQLDMERTTRERVRGMPRQVLRRDRPLHRDATEGLREGDLEGPGQRGFGPFCMVRRWNGNRPARVDQDPPQEVPHGKGGARHRESEKSSTTSEIREIRAARRRSRLGRASR